ncbi:orotate phosphoribosyltransferase [cf. Phormidesmis sp. LEGE 11477]|uniref:orotate phosphoribosyltransferase n=1 Tax=cf. Phormidesmis sp. LEGE 11477 TaxID=1828680 RepID=UPI001882DA20|nr:orotate phosphoribosyltransferase [cf. Phormidesmis sp. LEGE 11477]MBE9064179.1 orotate phosphoribosyltransferase [cf. Phormidesmis sp. LEGE 11477]
MSVPSTETATELANADMTVLRQRLLELICQVAYKEGNFTLSSGQESDYYINGKQVTLHAQGGLMVARILLDMLPDGTVGVGGLTLGADPMVSAVSIAGAYEGKPVTPLIIRKEAKGHGTQAYIEGPALPEGSAVVILEDVVTTGASAMKAVERLRAAGYVVNEILSLVDRQQGGRALYEAAGLSFRPIFTIEQIKTYWRSR